MSQVKVKHNFTLIKYFLFNTSWGNREGTEHEKLIYYYAAPSIESKDNVVTLDQKVSDIGLAEAAINFGRQFGDVSDSLYGNRLRFIFYELAPSFWSTMVITEPYSLHKSNDENNTQITEYHHNEIDDHYFKMKSANIYQYFRLLNGPIEMLCEANDRSRFIELCTYFFDNYIPHLELATLNLIELYSSIQYLPLSNVTFMAVQSLVNCVQATDVNKIKSYLFLYNDQLVTSSMSLVDTQILYNYLTNIILPEAVKEEINGMSNKTRWLNLNQRIYLVGEKKFCSLCIYRTINGATVGLLLEEFDRDLLKECEALIYSRIAQLTVRLHEAVTKINKQSEKLTTSGGRTSIDANIKDIKFIYVNKSNCAQRSNSNSRKIVDCDFSRLVIDVESDLQQINNSGDDKVVLELIGKNTADVWMVTRCADLRTLFAMINQKNANLIEATDMVDALQNRHLKNIFFEI